MEKQGISSLKTPNKGYNWSSGWSHVDSPGNGDLPFTQEIIWDATSPNTRPRGNRVIEISDIVNRIAPKNGKPLGPVSPWRQWMGDGAMMCTPENPQTRVRTKSIRQSNAEDLMKLARKFDNDLREQGETSVRTDLTEMPPQSEVEVQEGVQEVAVQEPFRSVWEQTELEFQAMFDSSTQRISGGLSSQGSSVSTRSQEKEGCPEAQATSAANGVPPQQTKPMSAGSSSQQFKSLHAAGANPTTDEMSSSNVAVAECDDVDDDWDDDELLLACFDQAMSQHSEPPTNTVPSYTSSVRQHSEPPTNTVQAPTSNVRQHSEPPTNTLQSHTSSVRQHSEPPTNTVQGPTSNVRPASTSQQTSDRKPHTSGSSACQVSRLPPQPHGPSLQELCPKPKTSNRSSFRLESNPHFQPSSVASDLDTTWDNLDDDLMYQVCETVEKTSSAQLEQTRSANCQQNVTTPLAIKTTRSINGTNDVKRQLSCTFVRSNSLPLATNYQGWNTPFKGAEAPQSVMSQSHPGTLEGLGTFSHLKDSTKTFQANMAVQPHTVTARPAQNFGHSSFKRTLPDTGVVSNKVHVTNQTTAKCSAAEIERKKREALARRRQRMETSQKR